MHTANTCTQPLAYQHRKRSGLTPCLSLIAWCCCCAYASGEDVYDCTLSWWERSAARTSSDKDVNSSACSKQHGGGDSGSAHQALGHHMCKVSARCFPHCSRPVPSHTGSSSAEYVRHACLHDCIFYGQPSNFSMNIWASQRCFT